MRKNLTEKLKEFVDVDVYGKCGTLTCPLGFAECDHLLDSTYRFYFAFENNLADDYLTEKTFRTMGNSVIIPVIYSGANLTRFLPPKSYIDANDFATVKDLADHLKFLSDNPKEYVKYFWWRRHYRIVNEEKVLLGNALCDLCVKLNDPIFMSCHHEYADMTQWFHNNSCKDPKIRID